MRRAHSVTLLGLAAPLLLLQAGPISCIPTGGGGGTTPLFNLPPTVSLTSDVQRGVAPLKVQFSSSASTDNGVIVQRLWDFGDGASSQEIAPTHTFLTNGTFTVRLTLTDDQGAQASKTALIIVTDRPVAVISVDPNTPAKSAPATFKFDGSASYDTDVKAGDELLYRWDFGDGSRELIPVVMHTFATSGTYRVRLTITDAVGVTGFTEKLIEVGIPTPQILFRSPPPDLANLVCSTNSPLWIHAVYQVEPGVPRTLRAGLDGDQDMCETIIALYVPSTGVELRRIQDTDPQRKQDAVNAAVFTPDGKGVLSGGDDGVVRLYDVGTGIVLRRYTAGGAAVTALAFAPGGATFAVGYRDGSVNIRETNSNRIVRAFMGHSVAVNAVAFSPDGTQVLSGDNSGVAMLWTAADATVVFAYHHAGAPVYAVAFSPGHLQRVLTGSADQTARLWSTVNGGLIQEFSPVFDRGMLVAGHAGAVTSVAFTSDALRVLTGSKDNTAKLWDASTGAELRTFSQHTAGVNSVGFSPDNTQIITGSDDGTAMIWNVATGNQLRTLQPCNSPIAAAGFAPTGATVMAAVAARNDIQLDTQPPAGNDLNLTLPTALNLKQVPTGATGRTYFLWIELDTAGQSPPQRTYSPVQVSVIPPFANNLDNPPAVPVIPLRVVRDPVSNLDQEVASVLMPPTQQRQVFNLGALDLGDRIFVSLLSTPGYGETFGEAGLNPLAPGSAELSAENGFSLLILDSQQKMFAWYETQRVLFTPDSKLIVGHDSTNYYVVLDGTGTEFVPSVKVRIQRGFSDNSEPRRQYVHLNFDGETAVAVANSTLFDVAPFTVPGRSAAAVNTIKTAIMARVQDLLKLYGFVISTSPPTVSTQPRNTVYFDWEGKLLQARIGQSLITAADLDFWGLTSFSDPRNETASGHAVIAVHEILNDPAGYGSLADAQLGLAIGNAVAHHIGLMSGLRETTQPPGQIDDVMTNDASHVADAALQFKTANLASSGTLEAIGIQDAPELLLELFGPY